jgi:hypothetical protein
VVEEEEEEGYVPWFSSKLVMVCHLFVATNHLSSFRRQERSMTILEVSFERAVRMESRRDLEKVEEGKR